MSQTTHYNIHTNIIINAKVALSISICITLHG